MEDDQQLIKDLIQNHQEPQKDNIFRTLYGKLTAKDAKFYENQIEMLKKDTRSPVDLIVNQTIQIKSEYNEQQIKFKNFAELSLYQFGNVSNAMKLLSRNLTDVQYNKILNDIAMNLESNIDKNTLDTRQITHGISLAEQGNLLRPFLSDHQIIESAKAIKDIKPNSELPVPLENEFAKELLQLSKLTIYLSGEKLIYIIAVPLLYPKSFKLYRNIPLPIPQQSNSKGTIFAYIKPNSPFTAISENMDSYYRLNDNELQDCKNTSKRFICQHVDALYRINSHSDCEVKIIVDLSFQDFATCDIHLRSSAHTQWSPIHGTNRWVFSSATSETVHIICENRATVEAVINGTGILYLPRRCEARTSSIVLTSLDEISTTISTKFIPRGNLDIFALSPSSINSLKIAELLRNVEERPLLFFDESAAAERDLQFQAIIDKADEMLNRKTVNNRMDRMAYYGVYCFIALGILVTLIAIVWKFSLFSYVKKLCSCRLCKKSDCQSDDKSKQCFDDQEMTKIGVPREPSPLLANAPNASIVLITPAVNEV